MNPETNNNSRHKPSLRAILRSQWLVVAMLLLAVVIAGKIIHRAMQPKYEGKTVEEWFEGWRLQVGMPLEAYNHHIEVYSSFGTNAVWYLWGEYRRKDSVATAWIMEKKHRFFGSDYKLETSHEEQRHLKALGTLEMLGARCEPLIPEIMAGLKSPDPDEVCDMISLLGSIRRQPDLVVPAIHLSLLSTNWAYYQRRRHIEALGEFGSEAKAALPELRKRFANPTAANRGENYHLAKAILQINGPGPELGLFTNSLTMSGIVFIQEIGTNAYPAVPVLREFARTLTNESEIKYIMKVIREIDPKGAIP